MKQNVGSYESLARVVIGFGFASLAFIGPKNPWFLMGLALVVTGFVSWCPIYTFFGLSTCKTKIKPLPSNTKL